MAEQSFQPNRSKAPFFAISIAGRNAVKELLRDVPDLTVSFTRQELVRFSKRVRKRTLKERLKGRPGIAFPEARRRSLISSRIKAKFKRTGTRTRTIGKIQDTLVGKNVRAWVPKGAKNLGELVSISKISKFLLWHEEGTTGKFRVPARLGFRKLWVSMVPDAVVKIGKAMDRAADVAARRSRKRAVQAFKRVI